MILDNLEASLSAQAPLGNSNLGQQVFSPFHIFSSVLTVNH